MRSLSAQTISHLSEDIRLKVERLELFERAKIIESYVARKDEVQTEGIIKNALKNRKRVIVPLTLTNKRKMIFSELLDLSELSPGNYSLLEPRKEYVRPVSLEEADVILVPIVAWDERGYRIGHGAGYFDRALAALTKPTIGLAFESQRVGRVPEDSHDIALKMMVTEKRVLQMKD